MSIQKKLLSLALTFVLLFTTAPLPVKASVTLPETKSITVWQSAKLKLSGNTDPVKWTCSNKKVVKITEENEKYVKIEGVKTGKATIAATIGEEKLKCKVTVKEVSKASASSGTSETATQSEEQKQDWILNKNSKKFHYPSCRDVGRMSARNKQAINATYSEMITSGYDACQHCKPRAY